MNDEAAYVQVRQLYIRLSNAVVIDEIGHGIVATIRHMEQRLRLPAMCLGQKRRQLIDGGGR